MILEEVLRELRDVESGYQLMHRPLAGKAADTIELLVDRIRYLEEKLGAAEVGREEAERELSAVEVQIGMLENQLGY